MRLEYQYNVDLRDYYNLKDGQLGCFNGFCKTIEDCIKDGKEIVSKYPEVITVYFARELVFPKLAIDIRFRKKSLVFDNYCDYFKLRYAGTQKVLWDSRDIANKYNQE